MIPTVVCPNLSCMVFNRRDESNCRGCGQPMPGAAVQAGADVDDDSTDDEEIDAGGEISAAPEADDEPDDTADADASVDGANELHAGERETWLPEPRGGFPAIIGGMDADSEVTLAGEEPGLECEHPADDVDEQPEVPGDAPSISAESPASQAAAGEGESAA